MLRRETDCFQQLSYALTHMASMQSMQTKRLGECLPHRHARIERRIRILKYELHRSALFSQGGRVKRAKIGPVEMNLTCAWLDQSQHETAKRRLAAA